MSIVDGNWKTFMARATVLSAMLGVVVFSAVKLAAADPGGPSSPDALTFAGVLRERMGTTGNTLTFLFRRSGGTAPICTVTTGTFAVDSGGAFSVLVPVGECPNSRTLFDGDTVVYDVRLGSAAGDLIASEIAITAVPYARFANQAGVNNDCPAGFALDRSASPGTVCVRSLRQGSVELRDEVVKVGRGATSFWIDRYEAGVYHVATGAQLNAYGSPATQIEMVGLLPNGRVSVATGELPLAVSTTNVPTVNITWFQANIACRANGKRLPTGDEWMAAAAGAVDPGSCNVSGGPVRAPTAGRCQSVWGAQDMIGNVGEWTVEWFAGVGTTAPPVRPGGAMGSAGWPPDAGYTGSTTNVTSGAFADINRPSTVFGSIPSAVVRGCSSADVAGCGLHAFNLNIAPSFPNGNIGFRCMIPR